MTRKRVRVDFSKMPTYTRPEEYEYRRQARSRDYYLDDQPPDYDWDDPDLWDMPGNPADYGDD